MKKRVVISFAMIAVFLVTLTLNIASAPGESRDPKYEVALSTRIIMIPTDPMEVARLEAWMYLTNPSREMERTDTSILHSIGVNWVKWTMIAPEGTSGFMQVYPNGTVVTEMGIFYSPEWGDRIRTVVHPMEKALVFYVGWEFSSNWPKGILNLIFEVNIEYEEQTLELVETLQVNAQ